jgi:hypothetical protein
MSEWFTVNKFSLNPHDISAIKFTTNNAFIKTEDVEYLQEPVNTKTPQFTICNHLNYNSPIDQMTPHSTAAGDVFSSVSHTSNTDTLQRTLLPVFTV